LFTGFFGKSVVVNLGEGGSKREAAKGRQQKGGGKREAAKSADVRPRKQMNEKNC
jgi:hypothetical protein